VLHQGCAARVELLPDSTQHVTLAVADGHHERGADEHGDLGDLDDFFVVDVAHRLEHGEEDVAVELQLRALMRLDRVLHGQRRQRELPRDRLHLARGRLLQADPHEAGGRARRLARLRQREATRAATTILVERTVADDRLEIPVRHSRRRFDSWSRRCRSGVRPPRQQPTDKVTRTTPISVSFRRHLASPTSGSYQ